MSDQRTGAFKREECERLLNEMTDTKYLATFFIFRLTRLLPDSYQERSSLVSATQPCKHCTALLDSYLRIIILQGSDKALIT